MCNDGSIAVDQSEWADTDSHNHHHLANKNTPTNIFHFDEDYEKQIPDTRISGSNKKNNAQGNENARELQDYSDPDSPEVNYEFYYSDYDYYSKDIKYLKSHLVLAPVVVIFTILTVGTAYVIFDCHYGMAV